VRASSALAALPHASAVLVTCTVAWACAGVAPGALAVAWLTRAPLAWSFASPRIQTVLERCLASSRASSSSGRGGGGRHRAATDPARHLHAPIHVKEAIRLLDPPGPKDHSLGLGDDAVLGHHGDRSPEILQDGSPARLWFH
jgi:hypothetical protein